MTDNKWQITLPVAVWLLLLLLRPAIDATWFLKNTDVGVSPLQVLGAGLPAFFVWAMWKRRGELASLLTSFWDVLLWGALLLLAALAAVIVDPGAESAGLALKFILPPLAILFGAVYLREESGWKYAAMAFAAAGLVPLLFLLYELIAGPMSTSLRGGVERYIGPYAQVSVYGLHLSLMLMGAGFLVLKYRSRWSYILLLLFTAILALSAAFLVHVSTWAVWLGLTALIVITLARRAEWLPAALLLAIAVLFTAAGFYLRSDEDYRPVFMPDVEIITSDAPPEWFANSRGEIWSRNMNDYFHLPWYAKLAGSSLDGRNYFQATASGAHNDFLRILMATGAAGLLLYFLWLLRSAVAIGKERGERRYFGLGAMVILLGYSVALTPTYIMPLVTALLPVLGGMLPRYARPAGAGRATRDDGEHRSDAAGRATRDDEGDRATRDDC